jgi:hypothetical protein
MRDFWKMLVSLDGGPLTVTDVLLMPLRKILLAGAASLAELKTSSSANAQCLTTKQPKLQSTTAFLAANHLSVA